MQVTPNYFAYVNNTIKRIVENFHCIGFLIIYKTIK